jgi:L-ascorbate metabolism protein UlaG (beta-lactamase superfamily)
LTGAGRVTYVGHATVLVELDGTRLLTDPVLRDRIGPLRRHGARPAPEVGARLDAVLVSHLHRDHADLPSLRRLEADPPVLAPSGSARILERAGFTTVTELEVGDSVNVGSLRVSAVEALHAHGRGPITERHAQVVGFEIAGRSRVYFAGDTDVFEGMRDLAGEDLALALLPVWGWGLTLGAGHMNPARAARAAGILSPRVAIPIHWGTFFPAGLGRVVPRYLTAPPLEFAAEVRRRAPQVEARILSPGEATSFSA